MKPLSANSASKIAHKTKKTILDAIKKGDLTASKNERGYWQIDPSELNRAFPYKTADLYKHHPKTPTKTSDENHENRLKIVELEAEVKSLRDKIETASLERERERGQLSEHIETLKGALMLEDKRPVRSTQRGLLRRLSHAFTG
jgi:predicted RNase H-like nuclease (RuvC/YqgF family)